MLPLEKQMKELGIEKEEVFVQMSSHRLENPKIQSVYDTCLCVDLPSTSFSTFLDRTNLSKTS